MSLAAELEAARAQIAQLEVELAAYIKLSELQVADIRRYEQAGSEHRPHCPERVPRDQLQAALEQLLASKDAETAQAANDALTDSESSAGNADRAAKPEASESAPAPAPSPNCSSVVIWHKPFHQPPASTCSDKHDHSTAPGASNRRKRVMPASRRVR